MKKVLFHAKVVLPDRILENGGVEVVNGRISRVFFCDDYDHSAQCVDCRGDYLSPGFIDIHLHGGGGSDVIDGTEEAVKTVIRTHAQYGTTAFLPATLSAERETVVRALQAIETVQKKRKNGPKILGAHLEGNFFSLAQKGAQDPAYIYPPTEENYRSIVDSVNNIKMISCAPELENALAFAREMTGRGIVMSAAHSDATYGEFELGVENGFTHVTHLYNGNSWLHSPYYYCQVGLCEAALLMDDVYVEVIADGKHLPKELLRLIYKIKGPDRINLCTDAMCAAGMPEGLYPLGGLKALVEDGVAMLPDRSSFAGSVCTGNRAVRTMYREAGVPLHDAVKMMTATPARILGIYGEMGSVTVGKTADLNVFDEEINIKYTLIDGEVQNDNLKEKEKKK